jgi:uncharacterized membrane protein YraQ (UPF0718 family)
VQEFAPRAWLARLLGGSDVRSVTIGVLMAIPGMMCTCCAAPVVIGLRRRNASAAAGAAFWLGNTVLNPATGAAPVPWTVYRLRFLISSSSILTGAV